MDLTLSQSVTITRELEAIEALDLTDENKILIREMMEKPVKMNISQVLAIWSIVEERIEEGNYQAGYQHMLNHANEFRRLGIDDQELRKVAMAVTTIGEPVGSQKGKRRIGPGRPVFLLIYKDHPLAVAISIGSNGFVVGMNRQSFDHYLQEGPPINKIGRYQSSSTDIIPGSPYFCGWASRIHDKQAVYENYKDGVVIKTQDQEPFGPWIYSEEIVGSVDRELHWYRKNALSGMIEYEKS